MKYVLVQWPETQAIMDLEWFDTECYLANNDRTIKEIGSSAYFVPCNRIDEMNMLNSYEYNSDIPFNSSLIGLSQN